MRRFLGHAATALILCIMAPLSSRATTEPPTMQSGGGQTPVPGGRSDSQGSQLGSGNRGTAQRGSDGASSVDPGKVRSGPASAGVIVGQVLSIDKDVYIVRKPDGHEVTLQADQSTDVQTVISMGQTVEAQVDAGGRLMQLRPAQKK